MQQEVSLTNSIEDEGGLTTGEIAIYASIVGVTSFFATFLGMYALRKLHEK